MHHHPISSDPLAPPCYIESVSSVPPDLPCYTESVGIKSLRWQRCSFLIRHVSIYMKHNPKHKHSKGAPLSPTKNLQTSTRIQCSGHEENGIDSGFQAFHQHIRCIRSDLQLSINRCQISLVLRNSEGQMTIDEGFACLYRLAEL